MFSSRDTGAAPTATPPVSIQPAQAPERDPKYEGILNTTFAPPRVEQRAAVDTNPATAPEKGKGGGEGGGPSDIDNLRSFGRVGAGTVVGVISLGVIGMGVIGASPTLLLWGGVGAFVGSTLVYGFPKTLEGLSAGTKATLTGIGAALGLVSSGNEKIATQLQTLADDYENEGRVGIVPEIGAGIFRFFGKVAAAGKKAAVFLESKLP